MFSATGIFDNSESNPHNPDDIRRRLDSILAFDVRPLLPQIECPALVIGASDDQLMPSWFAEEAAAALPAAQLEILTGGGHMLPETRAPEVRDLVLRFMSARSAPHS